MSDVEVQVDFMLGDAPDRDVWRAHSASVRVFPDGRGQVRLTGSPDGVDAVLYRRAERIVRRSVPEEG